MVHETRKLMAWLFVSLRASCRPARWRPLQHICQAFIVSKEHLDSAQQRPGTEVKIPTIYRAHYHFSPGNPWRGLRGSVVAFV